jgi:hypothetical protein
MPLALATVVLDLTSLLQTLINYSYMYGSQIPVAARDEVFFCSRLLTMTARSHPAEA